MGAFTRARTQSGTRGAYNQSRARDRMLNYMHFIDENAIFECAQVPACFDWTVNWVFRPLRLQIATLLMLVGACVCELTRVREMCVFRRERCTA